jgi:hypothetical protein
MPDDAVKLSELSPLMSMQVSRRPGGAGAAAGEREDRKRRILLGWRHQFPLCHVAAGVDAAVVYYDRA